MCPLIIKAFALRLFVCSYIIVITRCAASTWQELQPLPAPLYGMAVGAYNRHIYLIGGLPDTTKLTLYSVDSGSVTEGENQLFTHFWTQFWTQQDHIVYILSDGSSITTFDLSTETFSLSASAPSEVDNACLASSENYIFVVGGGSLSNELQVFDILAAKWITGNIMNTARQYPGCVVHNQYLYALSGWDTATTERIFINNIAYGINQWEESVQLMYESLGGRAISYEDKIYFFVGAFTSIFSAVQIIDTSTSPATVYDSEPLLYPLDFMGVIYFEQAIYVFGGQDDDSGGVPTDTVLYYNLEPKDTTSIPTKESNTPTRTPSLIPCFPQNQCNDGYMDKTNGHYMLAICGEACVGGELYTDVDCNCACIPEDTCAATASPVPSPTRFPTPQPTAGPIEPTISPTHRPSDHPSSTPSAAPTQSPSKPPTYVPSHLPTESPSDNPTNLPSVFPSDSPSVETTINTETTQEKVEHVENKKSSVFDTFRNLDHTQMLLSVALLLLVVTLFVIFVVMMCWKYKTVQVIKRQELIFQQHQGNIIPVGGDDAEEEDDDELAKVLALSLAEEEERKREQIEMMKQFEKRESSADIDTVANDDVDNDSNAESAHESDQDVLNTGAMVTPGDGEEIVDDYKQDVQDAMDNPASPQYHEHDAFISGSMEQRAKGISAVTDTDSDDDVLFDNRITLGGNQPDSERNDDDDVAKNGANVT